MNKIKSSKHKNKKKFSKKTRRESEFEEKLLDLARVTRVMAGGKRFRFRAVMVVGDRKGRVGIGVAKGTDVAQAIQKAVFQAKKNIIKVPIEKGTIPREIKVKYNSALVYLKPAPSGRGINAGGAVRVICDLAGLKDIIGKRVSRSGNKLNTARATVRGFEKISQSIK